MNNPDCHFGDHDWQANGQCRNCDAFNGGLLQWKVIEKAEREGRHHGNHYHRTIEMAAACKHPTHEEAPCAAVGGCMVHDATDEYIDSLSADPRTEGLR